MADEKAQKPAAASETPPPAEGAAPAADPKAKGGKPKAKFALPVLKPREKTIFQVFAFLFALLVVDLVLIHPMSEYLRQLDDAIRQKEEIIPKRLMILRHKSRILSDYRLMKPFLIEPSLSQEEETALFLREIERVSKETRFFVTNINPVKVSKKSDNIYELSLDVEGRGGLAEVRSFMRAIETSNPSIRVSAFNLKPQGKEAEELKALLSIVKLSVKKSHPSVSI